MQTNSKKVLDALPEFERFMELAEEIKSLSLDKMKLENAIKSSEAGCFREVMGNDRYFLNGKPVPVSHFENAFKHRGLEGEILELRNKLAETQAELDLRKNQFEIYKQMHDLFKTLVYQERVNT